MKSLLGMLSSSFRRTTALEAPVRSMSTSCSSLRTSWMGTPASSFTSMAMSCPARTSCGATGGVMRDASGTLSVSGTRPPPECPIAIVPGM